MGRNGLFDPLSDENLRREKGEQTQLGILGSKSQGARLIESC